MVFKYLHVILLASVKYFFTLPYAMIIGLDYKQALIAVLIGGIGGFLFFYYLSKPLIRAIDIVWPFICRYAPPSYRIRYKALCERRSSQRSSKIFSRKSRLIGKIRSTYGLWGIIFATPFLLTIPVGAFLASKYYSRHKHIVLYMILSIIGWAGILSGIVHLFPNVFF
jgi:hypothetical protein